MHMTPAAHCPSLSSCSPRHAQVIENQMLSTPAAQPRRRQTRICSVCLSEPLAAQVMETAPAAAATTTGKPPIVNTLVQIGFGCPSLRWSTAACTRQTLWHPQHYLHCPPTTQERARPLLETTIITEPLQQARQPRLQLRQRRRQAGGSSHWPRLFPPFEPPMSSKVLQPL